ncbi:hypothetical protein PIB30_084053 [Stylosanthes scabra]|uniref:Uncharacterized protein n=1 Tax=Stylosanthes scabra TaxID=79078 RepID=A0ABU6SUL3_9FABA|nr:hypothetical protein [Stylosanthes scabra]
MNSHRTYNAHKYLWPEQSMSIMHILLPQGLAGAGLPPKGKHLPSPTTWRRLRDLINDEYLNISENAIYCPFGDWKGESRKARKADIEQPPPPLSPPFGHPKVPWSALAMDRPSSSSAQPLDPLQKIMKMLRHQEKMLINTQYMISTTYTDTEFPDLL